jgi:hypothetical protein
MGSSTFNSTERGRPVGVDVSRVCRCGDRAAPTGGMPLARQTSSIRNHPTASGRGTDSLKLISCPLCCFARVASRKWGRRRVRERICGMGTHRRARIDQEVKRTVLRMLVAVAVILSFGISALPPSAPQTTAPQLAIELAATDDATDSLHAVADLIHRSIELRRIRKESTGAIAQRRVEASDPSVTLPRPSRRRVRPDARCRSPPVTVPLGLSR